MSKYVNMPIQDATFQSTELRSHKSWDKQKRNLINRIVELGHLNKYGVDPR